MTTLYELTMTPGGAFTFTPQAAPKVLFASPVTGVVGDVWGAVAGLGTWFDATGYATLYTADGIQSYHTGCDLNLPAYKDAGRTVYASAGGDVVFAGVVAGWQGQVAIVKCYLETGQFVWTRYAHIVTTLSAPTIVQAGDPLGTIADYNKDGPKGDHLHYDVARIDLGARPGDWPGMDKTRLLRDYINPLDWHMERST